MEEVKSIVDSLLKKDKKLTQSEIARQLGWSKSYISRCKNKDKEPENEKLHMQLDELTGDTVGTEPEPQTDPQTEPEPQIDTETPHITQSEPSGDPQQVIESQTAKPTDDPKKDAKELLEEQKEKDKLAKMEKRAKKVGSNRQFGTKIEEVLKPILSIEKTLQEDGMQFTEAKIRGYIDRIGVIKGKIKCIENELPLHIQLPKPSKNGRVKPMSVEEIEESYVN
jgi:transcriptional regulator with XRE-family HTH domain